MLHTYNSRQNELKITAKIEIYLHALELFNFDFKKAFVLELRAVLNIPFNLYILLRYLYCHPRYLCVYLYMYSLFPYESETLIVYDIRFTLLLRTMRSNL